MMELFFGMEDKTFELEVLCLENVVSAMYRRNHKDQKLHVK